MSTVCLVVCDGTLVITICNILCLLESSNKSSNLRNVTSCYRDSTKVCVTCKCTCTVKVTNYTADVSSVSALYRDIAAVCTVVNIYGLVSVTGNTAYRTPTNCSLNSDDSSCRVCTTGNGCVSRDTDDTAECVSCLNTVVYGDRRIICTVLDRGSCAVALCHTNDTAEGIGYSRALAKRKCCVVVAVLYYSCISLNDTRDTTKSVCYNCVLLKLDNCCACRVTVIKCGVYNVAYDTAKIFPSCDALCNDYLTRHRTVGHCSSLKLTGNTADIISADVSALYGDSTREGDVLNNISASAYLTDNTADRGYACLSCYIYLGYNVFDVKTAVNTVVSQRT